MKMLLSNEKVSLCLPTEYEESLILHWLNDPEVCRFTSHAVFPAAPYIPTGKELRLALYVKVCCGVIALQKIDWVHRNAELAILLGSHQGRGLGKAAAELICRHGFEAMNLHRIYCGTHEENIGMQKIAQHLGMTEEGRTRQAMYKNGKYADIVHYGVLRSEFDAHCSHLDRSGEK